MSYISTYAYYENDDNGQGNENWGSYQYVSLEDIVNNFYLIYADNTSLVNNVPKYKVLFYAKQAIQELNFDAFKEVKVLELSVDNNLRYVLPHDFVNWVRISLYKNGELRPLQENRSTNFSKAYLQDNTGAILFDHEGNIIESTSILDYHRIIQVGQTKYNNPNSPFNNSFGYLFEGNWYFDYNVGSRFGLDTTDSYNPSFSIDKKSGVINFSSNMSDELCVLEYVSDGMESGDNSKISVNKMFEKYVYAYIEHEILISRKGVQRYVIVSVRKRLGALRRNAKLRMSNIKPGRLLQSLRGKDKWIK